MLAPNEFQLMVNGNMATSLTSTPKQLQFVFMYSVQAVWTGAPVGGLKLQISNDNITYSDYTGSAVVVSGAGDFMWNVVAAPEPWVRVVYTRSSGTGTLNITTNTKG